MKVITRFGKQNVCRGELEVEIPKVSKFGMKNRNLEYIKTLRGPTLNPILLDQKQMEKNDSRWKILPLWILKWLSNDLFQVSKYSIVN